jgi:hypothetical protein
MPFEPFLGGVLHHQRRRRVPQRGRRLDSPDDLPDPWTSAVASLRRRRLPSRPPGLLLLRHRSVAHRLCDPGQSFMGRGKRQAPLGFVEAIFHIDRADGPGVGPSVFPKRPRQPRTSPGWIDLSEIGPSDQSTLLTLMGGFAARVSWPSTSSPPVARITRKARRRSAERWKTST